MKPSHQRHFSLAALALLAIVVMLTLPLSLMAQQDRGMVRRDSQDSICIRVTTVDAEPTLVFLPLVLQVYDGAPTLPWTGPTIEQVTEDTGGCLRFVGDSIHFTLDAGETGGTATVDIGEVHTSIELHDDGTNGDSAPDDGVYELDYTTTAADLARTVRIVGHFASSSGQKAPDAQSEGRVTIADWESGEPSVAPVNSVAADPVSGERYAAHRMVIAFEETVSLAQIEDLLFDYGMTLASWLPSLMTYEVELTDGQDYENLAQQLLQEPIVEAVGRNQALEWFGLPTEIKDMLMPIGQSDYLNPIRAKLGWVITKGHSTTKVAVIDTGALETHPDLTGQIVSYFTCPVCTIGDQDGHGTGVAGVVAAESGTLGISGVAPGVSLVIYQWSPLDFFSIGAALDITNATDQGARVVNMSWGTNGVLGNEATLRNAIEYAYEHDVVLIAAAGNDGIPISKGDYGLSDDRVYPASYTRVLAVGATDEYDNRWADSSYGAQVVFAPGELIESTAASGGYELQSGTSYAAPQVAALAALILSENNSLHNWEVIDVISSTADPVPAGGLGRVNVYRALQKVHAGTDPGSDQLPTAPSDLESTLTSTGTATHVHLTWTAPASDYAGVHIYRFEVDADDPYPRGDPIQVHLMEGSAGGLISGTSYDDDGAEVGKSYVYYVFSVDSIGQESVDYAIEGPLNIPVLGTTTRVSLANDGTQGDGWSDDPAISPDGRYVAFDSAATNLVSDDDNGIRDVFVRDLELRMTTRVSVPYEGRVEGNGDSINPSISADGRYIAFESESNLTGSDPNGDYSSIFVHDRTTAETTMVSVSSDWPIGGFSFNPSISADGRFVTFSSNEHCQDPDYGFDVFVHEMATGETTRIAVPFEGFGGGDSYYSSISANGRYVAFEMMSCQGYTEPLPGCLDETHWDILVYDREWGETMRVSISSDGERGNADSRFPVISADGRFVAFQSWADNLVSEDINGVSDVFVHDRQEGETVRVSVTSNGTQANDSSIQPSISPDGWYVTFSSFATNLVDDDTNGAMDVFMHDRHTGLTIRVSLSNEGTQAEGGFSARSAVSEDGQYVAFYSADGSLVSGDTNGEGDVFVRCASCTMEEALPYLH